MVSECAFRRFRRYAAACHARQTVRGSCLHTARRAKDLAARQGTLLPRMEIEFQPQGAGCTVTWRMFSRNTSLLARFTWLRLARRIISERATVGVAQLKRQLERS